MNVNDWGRPSRFCAFVPKYDAMLFPSIWIIIPLSLSVDGWGRLHVRMKVTLPDTVASGVTRSTVAST